MAIGEAADRAADPPWDWGTEYTAFVLAPRGTEGHEGNGVRTLVLATAGRRAGSPGRYST